MQEGPLSGLVRGFLKTLFERLYLLAGSTGATETCTANEEKRSLEKIVWRVANDTRKALMRRSSQGKCEDRMCNELDSNTVASWNDRA